MHALLTEMLITQTILQIFFSNVPDMSHKSYNNQTHNKRTKIPQTKNKIIMILCTPNGTKSRPHQSNVSTQKNPTQHKTTTSKWDFSSKQPN